MSERIVLASASPRRRELLAAVVDAFAVDPTDIPEPLTGDPEGDALALAEAKARVGADAHPGAVVIGADTIVFAGGRSYGKPADAPAAKAMWRDLRGRPHQVVTGIAVSSAGASRTARSLSEVVLTDLDDAAIARYVASGRPMDKAGAYAIQDEDVPAVAGMRGCYCGVMGLPLWALRTLLAEAGLPCRPPDAALPRCAACPERPSSA